MEQFHLRLTKEQKRHLVQIKNENAETLNGVILKAIDEYISNYYTETQEERSLPRIERLLDDRLNEFSTHLRSLIARGVLDNAVSMLGVVDLVSNETGQNQSDVYQMYRELAYIRVKDRHELFKDLDTLYQFKKELEDEK
ncbi:hypothetical protein RES1_11965 [Staphylococcus epidermidis]|jgi:hypothetical protein|uniref:hypothetical protein n=1 Tax=Staphylococcus TaxID=1279 RepID=UPI00026BFF6D|nr:hypothetical protein [Staphylococcus epidermidis]MCE3390709.1 hypothetical protein [Staphylococcus aureus]EJE11699.1 hypothetical protein HMPREF9980_12503 [Staphylococcus epidermidis NIHLM031]KSZ60843.1 hypothetical protein RES1_11965 [Staphylococcus epidermidis]KSZ60992.1 hypothetical protein RES3_11655 [Staphylococcus epidermidis]KSZ67573.1 hypothetical protein RES2_02120 [Staphylococcus epidermidis]